jgi:hypothetical protein
MKRLQAYLAGSFLLAAALASGSASAQTDTVPQKDKHRADSLRTWDRNTAKSNEHIAYTYIDLNTGDTLDYFYDSEKRTVMNRTSGLPVDFYINTTTGDTVYGRGRFVVNGLLLQGNDGKWKFNENKVKIDKDELKIKDGNRKLKIDGDEIKIKEDGRKIKADDKEVKIKDGKTKAKVDNEEMKVKDENGKAKYEKDKTKIKDGDTKIKRKEGDSTKIKNDNR